MEPEQAQEILQGVRSAEAEVAAAYRPSGSTAFLWAALFVPAIGLGYLAWRWSEGLIDQEPSLFLSSSRLFRANAIPFAYWLVAAGVGVFLTLRHVRSRGIDPSPADEPSSLPFRVAVIMAAVLFAPGLLALGVFTGLLAQLATVLVVYRLGRHVRSTPLSLAAVATLPTMFLVPAIPGLEALEMGAAPIAGVLTFAVAGLWITASSRPQ